MTTDKKKEELRKKVEFQVACEEKAFRIVERLIDNPITQDFFHDALNFITPSHYSDIVEERAVSKLCGYPLCPNTLDKVLKQKYMISTKTNKVYDIEERKNFCSGKCYRASLHVEKQISSDPLWMRKSRQPTQFSFLPLDMEIGQVGDEILLNMAEDLKEEIKTIEKMDEYQQRLEERKSKLNKKSDSGNASHAESQQTNKGNSSSPSPDREAKEANADMGERVMSACHTDGTVIGNFDDDDDLRIVTSDVVKASINATNTKCSSDTTQKNKKSDSSTSSKQSKSKSKGVNPQTEYLMKLLDKRKELLSKMADIQPSGVISPTAPVSSNTGVKHSKVKCNTDKQSSGIGSKETVNVDSKPTEALVSIIQKDEMTKNFDTIDQDGSASKTGNPAVTVSPGLCVKESVNTVTTGSVARTETEEKSRTSATRKTKVLSPVEVLVDVVKSWVTKESLEYLSVEEAADNKENKTKFEKQYQELVARVDAQEKDFDDLIGEELMETPEEDMPKAPLPDYEQLKKETEENFLKVNAYLKGAYKIKEKNPTQDVSRHSTEVVLPSLDKYNQMLIRRKIVVDRISKVLPELLSTLQLLTQDVFTELRELVSTFNLTSENITFKPAEWTLVTLILLKLLCRKVELLQTSFTSSMANSHFGMLLHAVHCDMNRLDELVQYLLQ